MQSVKLLSRVGADGILHLDVPVDLKDVELEVTVTVKPVTQRKEGKTPEELGWPPGFFEKTYGCLADDPIIIDSEGEYDRREQLL